MYFSARFRPIADIRTGQHIRGMKVKTSFAPGTDTRRPGTLQCGCLQRTLR